MRDGALYAEMAKHIEAVAPDVLIIFTDDHFNTFFLDNFPTFAIGIADATAGPNDQTPMPHYKVAVPGALAAHIRASCHRATASTFRWCRILRSITPSWYRCTFLRRR